MGQGGLFARVACQIMPVEEALLSLGFVPWICIRRTEQEARAQKGLGSDLIFTA